MTYQLSNLDPFNALDIGSLSVPLVFQVLFQDISRTLSNVSDVACYTMPLAGHGVRCMPGSCVLHDLLLQELPLTLQFFFRMMPLVTSLQGS